MAAGSGASSSTASRGPSGQSDGQSGSGGQPLCPFCRTATVVEQTSGTTKNPNKQFYTCRNRDWGNSRCSFFMWKPERAGVDAATLLAGLQALENSLVVMSNVVEAQSLVLNSLAAQQRINKWMNVFGVCVGLVGFVLLCKLMYNQA